jgi:succinate dehydrogenase/fumarate reductase flavoprotein subunit
MPDSWNLEADMVVVGYGAAGSAAALTASRAGASVIVLEKQPSARHTPNIVMSGGLFMTVDDVEQGVIYLTRCAGGMISEPLLRALAERASKLVPWLNEVVPNLPLTMINKAEHPDFPGAEGISVYQPGHARFKMDFERGAGRHLFAALSEAVAKTSAKVFYETPAERLIRGSDDRIHGVAATRGGSPIRVKASKGVILAPGGFEYDEAAKLNFLRAYPMYFYGNPGNTGDGLRMAQAVGADLWHMSLIVGRAIGNFRLPNGQDQAFFINVAPPGYVITDRYGQRFANEDSQAELMHSFYFDLIQFDPARGIYPRIPSYWFFDEKRRRAGALTPKLIGACGAGIYDWSDDNLAEIDAGWIASGATAREAAAKAGIDDPDAAAATVAAYNETCKAGGGDPFGRSAKSLIAIDEGPFYCVKLWPGGSNTTGGPRRDERGRVLDVYGQPVPGLYAAGELGQVSGLLYAADGFNLCEAFSFGQIAAEGALDER